MAIKFDELLEALDPSLDKFEEDLDSMWIIIPTERRYDDLTANDYDEFINKYGTFNSRQECWDKIDKLAPDRWDAFIPLRIDGVNEALNEDISSTKNELKQEFYRTKKELEESDEESVSYLIDFTSEDTKNKFEAWYDSLDYIDKDNYYYKELDYTKALEYLLNIMSDKELEMALDYQGESLNEDWAKDLDFYSDEISKFMNISKENYNKVCNYIDDELRKPNKGIGELNLRELQELYSAFIESDRF